MWHPWKFLEVSSSLNSLLKGTGSGKERDKSTYPDPPFWVTLKHKLGFFSGLFGSHASWDFISLTDCPLDIVLPLENTFINQKERIEFKCM
jgi:hypothetical protein